VQLEAAFLNGEHSNCRRNDGLIFAKIAEGMIQRRGCMAWGPYRLSHPTKRTETDDAFLEPGRPEAVASQHHFG